MPETPEERPPTLLEALFKVVDGVARKINDFLPLGREIRKAARSQGEGLVNWDNTRDIAVATLNMQREKPEPISDDVVRQYQRMLGTAEMMVADYTRLEVSDLPTEVEVFRQRDWIETNIESFRFLFDPISEKYARAIEEAEQGQVKAHPGQSGRRIAHTLLTVQVGVIIGYLARNVLGQFDLSLPEPERGSRLYLVEDNVRRVNAELGLHPGEFRQWITLHEVTHSFEFHCNDWLREYMADSMKEYLDTIDLRGLSRPDLLRKIRDNNVQKDDALRAGGLISLIVTPEQREILKRLQAVMSVLEGYSNHVMDRVGEQMLPSYSVMKERFERKRESRSGAERLFRRLIGIDLKLQQYRLGQVFVDAVVDREGVAFLNRVWTSPNTMPSMEEIVEPGLWMERLKGGS